MAVCPLHLCGSSQGSDGPKTARQAPQATRHHSRPAPTSSSRSSSESRSGDAWRDGGPLAATADRPPATAKRRPASATADTSALPANTWSAGKWAAAIASSCLHGAQGKAAGARRNECRYQQEHSKLCPCLTGCRAMCRENTSASAGCCRSSTQGHRRHPPVGRALQRVHSTGSLQPGQHKRCCHACGQRAQQA